jgi:hypothetical protein
VVRTRLPVLLDRLMSRVPRTLAWRFSSARPGSVPANGSLSTPSSASVGSAIGRVSSLIPRLAASARASLRLWEDEKLDGMATPTTRSRPRASAAMAATRLESMPPDRPTWTRSKPFLVT